MADDDESDRQEFKEAFKALNIHTGIHTVNDGPALMAYLHTRDIAYPQYLFLDLKMPRKSGMQCLQEIRSTPKFDKMFIAIYSASAYENDMEETYLNDANVYIIKPVNFTKLTQVLGKALNADFQFLELPFDKNKFLLTA